MFTQNYPKFSKIIQYIFIHCLSYHFDFELIVRCVVRLGYICVHPKLTEIFRQWQGEGIENGGNLYIKFVAC